MTPAAARLKLALAEVGPAKRSKYGNRKVVVDGVTFDSAKEARRYGELRSLERRRLISGLELQPVYRLEVNGVLVCKYKPDFRYTDSITKALVIEDVKGVRTREFIIKSNLMRAVHGITVRET